RSGHHDRPIGAHALHAAVRTEAGGPALRAAGAGRRRSAIGGGGGAMITDELIKGARILVVEDDAGGADVLGRILRNAGYQEVDVVPDAEQAAAAHERAQPDLVLLDLHLPGRNGFWLLEQFHDLIGDDEFRPVIVLTG